MANSGNWRVYVGTISQNTPQTPFAVKKIMVHEKYNKNTNDYDIALLKLASPVTFSGELDSLNGVGDFTQKTAFSTVKPFSDPKEPYICILQ